MVLKNPTLKSISRLFVISLVVVSIVLVAGIVIVERKIRLIEQTWNQHLADSSNRFRLENELRDALGYGGMIHHFKNYVLRHRAEDAYQVRQYIVAARRVSDQYLALGGSIAERLAIADVKAVLNKYQHALTVAQQRVKAGHSIRRIDSAVKVDDQLALRALLLLRNRLDHKHNKKSGPAEAVADLRAAIGYGGMIHNFKNYILRNDSSSLAVARKGLADANIAIAAYEQFVPSQTEQIALDAIESTLLRYDANLKRAQVLHNSQVKIARMDSELKIDDSAALKAFEVLDLQLARQAQERSQEVGKALVLVTGAVEYGRWVIIILVVGAGIALLTLMNSFVVQPLVRLTRSMTRLTDGDLNMKINDGSLKNEVGDMARATIVFRENAIKQKQAEQRLAAANVEIKRQLGYLQVMKEKAEFSEQQARTILDTVTDAIITVDMNGNVETVNPAAETMFGYSNNDIVGQSVSVLVKPELKSEGDDVIKTLLRQDDHSENEDVGQRIITRDGRKIPVEISSNEMKIAGESKYTIVIRDISLKIEAEKKIRRLALFDSLTCLANRYSFGLSFDKALKMARRNGYGVGLMLIDLDRFKSVNDLHGHPIGDAVLKYAAASMTEACREVDTIARLGGDEFAIVLNSVSNPLDAVVPAEKIINSLRRPMIIEQCEISIGVSIGISFFPEDGEKPGDLIKKADIALYQGKKKGGNSYCCYSEFKTIQSPLSTL